MMKTLISVAFTAVFALGHLATGPLGHSLAYAEIPRLIRYQGQLADHQGTPLEGSYTLTFRLYDAETGGTKLWKERQPNIPLTGGQFSVLLGQLTPLSVDWGRPCWLSIQVITDPNNPDPELAPRQRITSVPLAIKAEAAEHAETADTADRLTQPITPTLITPQGSGSGLDADTIDGKQATDLLNRANHTGTQPSSTIIGNFVPSSISPQGSGSGLDADTVDGMHANELRIPRGQAVYRCPKPNPTTYGMGLEFSIDAGTCIDYFTASNRCEWKACNGNPQCWVIAENCVPVGFLMP